MPTHPMRSSIIKRSDGLAIIWALAISGMLFWGLHDYGFDDPYITYRYAANLANGYGLVYNQNEPILSTTAPFYAIVLALPARVGWSIPLTSNMLSALSHGFGALALYLLGRLGRTPIAAAAALLLYPLTPNMLAAFGNEIAIMNALILWGYVAAFVNYPVLAGLLLAGATLIRSDAALATAILALLLVRRGDYTFLTRLMITYVVAVTPFIIAAWVYYGSPLPITLGTKRSQLQITGSQSFFAGLLLQLQELATNPLFWPTFALTPLGLWFAIRRPSPLSLPLTWGLLHALAYSLLGVTNYFWYYGPLMLALAVATALGAQSIGSLPYPRLAFLLTAILCLAIFVGQMAALRYFITTPDPRLAPYRAAGEWIRQNTPPDASIGSLEVGIIGFYSQRYIIDFAGLIQPELATVFSPTAGYDVAARQAIERYRPNYLVSQEQTMPLVTASPALSQICTPMTTFAAPRLPSSLTIYHCVW